MTENATPTDEALENLGEAAAREEEAATEVVEEVVEEVAEEVAAATETATEAAAEAAETVEETVEEAVEAATDLDVDAHGEAVYNRVMQRLQEEGHIPTPAIAEEMAGEAEHEVEVVEEAPTETVAPVATEAPAVARPDTRPVSEHWWYRPRRFLGRSW